MCEYNKDFCILIKREIFKRLTAYYEYSAFYLGLCVYTVMTHGKESFSSSCIEHFNPKCSSVSKEEQSLACILSLIRA